MLQVQYSNTNTTTEYVLAKSLKDSFYNRIKVKLIKRLTWHNIVVKTYKL